MNYVINNQVVLSQVPEGRIAVYIDAFFNSLNSLSYAPHYIHQQVLLAERYEPVLTDTVRDFARHYG